MGLSFADIQNLSREATAMYPPRQLPVFTEISAQESRVADVQIGFANRLRKSAYYVVEKTKSTGKYHQALISDTLTFVEAKITGKLRMNIDAMGDEDEEEKSGDDHSDAGSNVAESDYDVDEEYDNDYAENYFDNGENDDMDDLGGGGGGDDGGGGDYD
ncbi:hypothetical protein H0H87_012756 [Tephrocybe sp. NHM501043]|nr:hypothetical protein H0H87_012756 [Tephrocybe sp. NHM501043]